MQSYTSPNLAFKRDIQLHKPEIADNLRNAIDNNLYSCGVFLDFSKAFDTILLKKWNSRGYGVSPSNFLQAILQIDKRVP